MCRFISEHCSVSLICVSIFVPVPYCLDYCSLKLESMIPLTLFFFLKIVLAVEGLLCFHTTFKIICSSSVKKTFGV